MIVCTRIDMRTNLNFFCILYLNHPNPPPSVPYTRTRFKKLQKITVRQKRLQ